MDYILQENPRIKYLEYNKVTYSIVHKRSNMFVNRKEELEILKNTLNSDRAELFILYGRRRVGKTELLKQMLIDNKNTVYFLGRFESPKDMVLRLSKIVAEKFDDKRLAKFPFRDFNEAFHYFSGKKGIVIIVDEFPYMVSSEPALPSIMQDYWDNQLKNTDIKLFICGSSIGMMEKHFFNYSSPLYGRRTKQFKLQPLSFSGLKDFIPSAGFEELLAIYAVFGGTPAYILEYENDIFETIRDKMLRKEQFLHKDAEFILREELREPRYYFSIIRSIAFGNTTTGRIMNDTGITKDVVGKYLSTLQDLDIIERQVPITESFTSRKGIYRIKDNYFRFYFRFIFPYIEHIEMGEIDYVLNVIKTDFQRYSGQTFEQVMIEQLKENRDLDPIQFTRIGSWWDKGTEIDIVAFNEETGDILFGEIKYTNRKVGVKTLLELQEKAKKVKWGTGRREHYMIISKSGFDDNIIDKDVTLIDLNMLETVTRNP
jgi:AAA+ ATPase superfamily predicted ATPase